jgi:hypothetical protein
MVLGSTNCNDRGVALSEFLNSSDLEIINQGNHSTYNRARRLEVIDITLGSVGLSERFTTWKISSEPSMSDHRHILFMLDGSILMCLIRNPKGTN